MTTLRWEHPFKRNLSEGCLKWFRAQGFSFLRTCHHLASSLPSDRQTDGRTEGRTAPGRERSEPVDGSRSLCDTPASPGHTEPRPAPHFINNLNKGFNNKHPADGIYNSNAYLADVKFNTLLGAVCFPPKQLAIVLLTIKCLYFSFLRGQKKSDILMVKVKGGCTFCFCRKQNKLFRNTCKRWLTLQWHL